MQKPLDALEQGDRIRVTLSDGTELVGLLENDPDTGPPTTPDGEAAGWDEKTLLGAVHVEDSEADYESLMLSSERYGEEWTDPEVVGYVYVGDTYESETLDVEEVEEVASA